MIFRLSFGARAPPSARGRSVVQETAVVPVAA
eukprot:CAMPEP_0204609220 /NCGR_PEP_ID=MMETSP0661-20131031/60787_1 /ASSEMBLY_ACC=CAM_ASM_000606 /TAXON_ID=109239 /ORGANISM="Alexandrium margalefi, Strain AMGDE01CS-322" /LENGTH=31 /DNA_ID= /DNA_START= /DNA_END= /DNA_ORIENTATION=